MGVGSVTSVNNMSSIQMTRASSSDVKSKKIQDEITDLQQQMQKVSSKEELSADEKANERKKQQQEISSLNTELKRHQEDVLRTQKREMMLAELQKDEDQGTVIFKNNDGSVILKEEMNQDEERGVDTDKKQTEEKKEEDITKKEAKPIEEDKDADKDTGLSNKEMREFVSADASAQQVSNQAAAIAKIRGGITVLKGEIKQDERHGINTDKKQAELEKLEKKEERVGEIYRKKKPAANMKVSGIQNKKEDKAIINASKLFKEEDQASQQSFSVSLGN